jgi:hypothetical protein
MFAGLNLSTVWRAENGDTCEPRTLRRIAQALEYMGASIK